MATGLEDVEGGGDVLFLEGFVEAQAVGDGDGLVVGGVEEERGRGGGVDLGLVGEGEAEGGIVLAFAEEVGDGAGVGDGGVEGEHSVAEDHEVGAGRRPVRGVSGGGVAGVVVGAGGGGEVASGREAHDADAGWIDAVGGGAVAHQAEGALGVLEGNGVAVAIAAEAIVEDVGGDAEAVEEAGWLDAFVVLGESAVAAAGADDDGAAVGLSGFGGVEIEGGLVFWSGAGGLGGAVGPEGEVLGFTGEAGQGEEGEQEEDGFHGAGREGKDGGANHYALLRPNFLASS